MPGTRRAEPVGGSSSSPLRGVVALLFPGFAPLDLAGPLQAFAAVRPHAYKCHLIALASGIVPSDCPGMSVAAIPVASVPERIDTLLLPGGRGIVDARLDGDLIAQVRDLASRSRRVASVCVGAYLSAEAGLLDGRKAATHWRACAHFAETYPKILVDPDAIYVRDGRMWSSAGISAGIDLTLALIEDDLGRAEAMRVARELVVFLQRPGGQSQYSSVLESQTRDRGGFGDLFVWIRDHAAERLTVERVADAAGMSARTFVRRFRAATNTTPAKAVERVRVEAACALIASGQPLARVAQGAGFVDEQRMRRAFLRQIQVTPGTWRKRFGPHRAAEPD